jgi:hypothetical protein
MEGPELHDQEFSEREMSVQENDQNGGRDEGGLAEWIFINIYE